MPQPGGRLLKEPAFIRASVAQKIPGGGQSFRSRTTVLQKTAVDSAHSDSFVPNTAASKRAFRRSSSLFCIFMIYRIQASPASAQMFYRTFALRKPEARVRSQGDCPLVAVCDTRFRKRNYVTLQYCIPDYRADRSFSGLWPSRRHGGASGENLFCRVPRPLYCQFADGTTNHSLKGGSLFIRCIADAVIPSEDGITAILLTLAPS